MSEHITAEDLAAYLDGLLAEKRRAGVEEHLSRCGACLEELGDLIAVRNSRQKVPPEFLRRAAQVPGEGTENARIARALRKGLRLPRPIFPARLAYGVAAAFLVAVVAGHFFLGRGRPGPAERARKQDSQLAAPAAVSPSETGENEATGRAVGPEVRARPKKAADDSLVAEARDEERANWERKKTLGKATAPGGRPPGAPGEDGAGSAPAPPKEESLAATEVNAVRLREHEALA
ncbi:MAG: zf-HC2 domain-containing protein, partial [Candidatus Aminicenantes bacterium]|nr:zf-HC2 domain-containing protein [Candidatus Aminicenantes bacterium]